MRLAASLALNEALPASSVRKPRGKVRVNGLILDNWTGFDVRVNSHYVSDTYTVKLPLYAQPADYGLDFWMEATDLVAELLVESQDSSNTKSLIIGPVDNVGVDAMTGVVTFSGRDWSGALIETKILTTDFLNLTASQAARKIVGQHVGLTGAITETKTPIGVYYGDQNVQVRSAHQMTEWDFLTALADQEGFQVLVDNATLYFGPPPTLDKGNPFIVNMEMRQNGPPQRGNATQLSITRSLTFARDVYVTVKSADPVTGKAVTAEFHSVASARGNRAGQKLPAQRYFYNIPSLNQSQAQQKAQALAKQITLQERLLIGTMPGDPTLTKSTVIQLIGTNSLADQYYYPDSINHRLSFDGGYLMDVHAKNHSTSSTVAL